MQSRSGRARLIGGVLLIGTVAAVGATGPLALGSSGPRPGRSTPAPASSPSDPSARLPAGVDSLLLLRGRAVLQHDVAGWLATVDPADHSFAVTQRALFDALRQLPLTRWAYQPVGAVTPSVGVGAPGPSEFSAPGRSGVGAPGPGGYSLHVRLGYRLPGDTRDLTRDYLLRLTHSAAGWRVAGQRAWLPQASDPWDLGPIAVAMGARSLVIGAAGRRPELRRFAADLDAAARRVDAAWGTGWPRTVTALIPQDLAGMAALLGPDRSPGLDQLAAVTTGQVDPPEPIGATAGWAPKPAADRVVINSDAFAGFGTVGRAVVLTHEVTHLATRAGSRLAPPLWLQEGFADYVAYRDSGLDRHAITADLLDQVRAGRPPAALPLPAEFDAARGAIGPAYAGSWLAVDLIARQRGPAAVARFYREAAGISDTPAGIPAAPAVMRATPAGMPAAAGGMPSARSPATAAGGGAEQALRDAFRDILGVDQPAFVAQWRAVLAELARAR